MNHLSLDARGQVWGEEPLTSRDDATGSSTRSHRASCRQRAGLARFFYTAAGVHAADELTAADAKARGRNQLDQGPNVHRPVLPVPAESSSRRLRRYTHHLLGMRRVILAPSMCSRPLTPPAPARVPLTRSPC